METNNDSGHGDQPNKDFDLDDEEIIHPTDPVDKSQELDYSLERQISVLDRHIARLENRAPNDSIHQNQPESNNGRRGRNQTQSQEQSPPAKGRGNRAQNNLAEQHQPPSKGRGNRNPLPQEPNKLDESAWDDSKDKVQNDQNNQENSHNQQHPKPQDSQILDKSVWDDEDAPPNKPPSKQTKRQGRTPNPPVNTPKQDDQQSAWDSGDEKDKKQPAPRNGRNKPKQQEEENQLEPDKAEKVNNSNWEDSKDQPKEKSPEPQNYRGRGNRGNRGNRDEQNEENNYNGGRGGRGNRQFGGGSGFHQRNYGRQGGFDREQGRGGLRGGRGGYGGGRGGFGGGGFGRGNREQGGFGRGNREQGGFGRGNREEGGGFGRGNREDGGFGRGNREQGGFNRGNRYEDGNRGPFSKKEGGFGNFSNGNDNFKGNQNFNNEHQNIQSANNVESSSVRSAVISDAIPIIEPKGLESWPEVSLYVKKCKVSLTLRSINQHQADGLVFPVQNMNFKLYPSVLINADEKYNYRDKIKQKFDTDYWSKFCVYRKKAEGMGKFRDIFFCKVDTQIESNYSDLAITLLKAAINEPKCESLVFPICKELKNFEALLCTFIQCLIVMSEHKKSFIKRLEFSTKDTDLFKECAGIFLKKISEDIDVNKIYIE